MYFSAKFLICIYEITNPFKYLPFADSKNYLFHTKIYWKHTDKSTCCKLRPVLIKYLPLKQITKYQCSCSKHGVFFCYPAVI